MAREHLFPQHPYGHPQDGYPDTIQSIEREDLVKFHAGAYNPEGMILVVVGAVSSEQVFGLAERYFADWRNPKWRLPESGFSLESVTHALIDEALRESRGNVSAAARRLGVTRDFLRYRLESLANETPNAG